MAKPSKGIPHFVSRRLIGLHLLEIEAEKEKRRNREERARKLRELRRARAEKEKARLEATPAEETQKSLGSAEDDAKESDVPTKEPEETSPLANGVETEQSGQSHSPNEIQDRNAERSGEDSRRALPSDECTAVTVSSTPKVKEAVITPEMPSIAHDVEPYQMLRVPISQDEEKGRAEILVFCSRIYELPLMDGSDSERRNERDVRLQRESPLINYQSSVLFEAAVAAGGISSSKLRLALDHAMKLSDAHYVVFREWFGSLEQWLYKRLTASAEGRAILAAEVERFIAGE